MDLIVVLFSLQVSMLLMFLESQEGRAGQLPTRRHLPALHHKEAKEYLERRRKHGRHRETFSLKPAPQDWPEPALVAGDFLSEDRPKATDVSPLRAYQAKLEQELIRQQREAQSARQDTPEAPSASLELTSSEEDFKKLLNPDELLKHNKQLRPFVNQGKTKTTNTDVKSAGQQGNKGVDAAKTKSSPLKASAGPNKTKRKSKVTTTDGPSRRGRKRKTIQKELLDDLTPLKELKKRKVKMKNGDTEVAKTKKRRRKVRKFAFAGEYSKEYESESTTTDDRTKTTHSEEISLTTIEPVTPSTHQITAKSTSKGLITTKKIMPQGTTEHPETYKYSKPEFEQTTSKRASLSKTTTPTILTTKNGPTSQPHPSKDGREEIREKRKQIKQEMEKVVEAEQLDGSFSDRESHWTTSEKKRLPLSQVTPRHALLNILKNRIVSFVDSVLKESPKVPDDQTDYYEENISEENDYTTEETS